MEKVVVETGRLKKITIKGVKQMEETLAANGIRMGRIDLKKCEDHCEIAIFDKKDNPINLDDYFILDPICTRRSVKFKKIRDFFEHDTIPYFHKRSVRISHSRDINLSKARLAAQKALEEQAKNEEME